MKKKIKMMMQLPMITSMNVTQRWWDAHGYEFAEWLVQNNYVSNLISDKDVNDYVLQFCNERYPHCVNVKDVSLTAIPIMNMNPEVR